MAIVGLDYRSGIQQVKRITGLLLEVIIEELYVHF
jgi:hypothetical protein